MPTSSSGRPILVHALRIGLFVAVVWLIHDAHRERTHGASPVGLGDVSSGVIAELYGDGARLSTERAGVIVDAAGETVGVLMQTSPQADHIIGFSGPTNVLIGFDEEGRIVGVRLLSSGDTREHVQQVRDDAAFLKRFVDFSAEEAAEIARIDAVSGATLTSLAVMESVLHRLGGGLGSLKFPGQPTIEDAQPLFPNVVRMEQDESGSSWRDMYDADQQRIGGLLRTSPAADNIVGYQGPTETLIGFDAQGSVIGIVVGASYDNEPYVGYVREDEWFRNSFNGQSLGELGSLDLEAAGVEGVSGATMTSMAVAEGMVEAAAEQVIVRTMTHDATHQGADAPRSPMLGISIRNWGTIGVLAAGLVIGLTSLRGKRWVRVPFQCVLIGYLGFINGDLISQALLVSWAKHGVPWESMAGVFLLTVTAFLIPITTKHNIYCHQLCPHGAAQQWLRPSKSRRLHLPRRLHRLLLLIPGGLLLLVVAVAMGAVSLSLVDVEPFDAYLITIAGAATMTIAVVGLIASAFVPMAYCRYGCPTGAAIEYVRRHAHSDRLSVRDAFAVGCLVLALLLR